jgi:hypothetical protein
LGLRTFISGMQDSEQTWEGPGWLQGFHAPLNKLPCFERVMDMPSYPVTALHSDD